MNRTTRATLALSLLLVTLPLLALQPYGDPYGDQTQRAPRPNVAIAELLLDGDDPRVALTNLGAEPIELSGWFLCNRPSYAELPERTLAPGQRLVVHLGTAGEDTDREVFLERFSAPGRDAGELALYRDGRFARAESMVDFVQWGGPGGPSRADVASDAGIWTQGFVDALPEGRSLYYDGSGSSPSDYFAGPSALATGEAGAIVIVHNLSDRGTFPGTIHLPAGEATTWLNVSKSAVHDPVQLLDESDDAAFGVTFAVRPDELTEVTFTPTAGTYTISHRLHRHPISGTVVVE